MGRFGPGELLLLTPFLLIPLLTTLGLALWARHLGKTRSGRFWRVAHWLPWAALGALVSSTCVTAALLMPVFRAVANVAPEHKQELLDAGIAEATGLGALCAVPAAILYLFCFTTLLVASFRRS